MPVSRAETNILTSIISVILLIVSPSLSKIDTSKKARSVSALNSTW